MEIKTSQEILDMMEEADDARAVTDGTHWNVKWVSVQDLKKELLEWRQRDKSKLMGLIDANEFIKLFSL